MSSASPAPAQKPVDKSRFWTVFVPQFLNYLVLVLAFGLIAFISWDTYKGVNFIENAYYMKYQFTVCMIFIAEYLYRFIISKHKIRFFLLAFPFLLISIPYLNIIQHYHIVLHEPLLYYIRFIPILRGLVALVMVVNFVTANLSKTVFASYVLVLVPIVYISGLFFYTAERHVNEAVKNFWYALWWAGMNVTTIGCDINPVTSTGMILGFILSLLGIIMLPLFTVYFGDVIQVYNKKVRTHSDSEKE